MTTFLQAFFDGLSTGSIYASLALALVFVFRATEISNFAQGELATLSAFIAWSLQTRGVPILGVERMPWVPAVVVSVVISFFIGFVIQRAIIRWVDKDQAFTLILITLGLFSVINSSEAWYFGTVPKTIDTPWSTRPIHIFGAVMNWDTPIILGMVAITLALVYVLFRFTKLGLGLRASAMNPTSARLVGVSVGTMLGVGWGISCAIGAVAGTMTATQIGLQPNMLSTVLIYAFVGAVIGGFDSPAGAVLGGFLVAWFQSYLSTYWHPYGNNLSLVIAFVVIAFVLLVRPNGLFGKAEVVRV
jgi:branched-chain amino acid transport system permease protein